MASKIRARFARNNNNNRTLLQEILYLILLMYACIPIHVYFVLHCLSTMCFQGLYGIPLRVLHYETQKPFKSESLIPYYYNHGITDFGPWGVYA